MIECLINHVGLRSVAKAPTSDVFVNDLNGISTNQFEATREIDENDGTLAAWRTLEGRAIRSFETDIKFNLKKYFKNHQTISTGITGFVDDNTLADHGSGKYAGWLFDVSSYAQSLKIEINDVRLTLTTDQDFNVKIFDANTGKELFDKAVTGKVGLNVIKVLKSYAVYNHNKIFVAYDTVIPIRVFNDPSVPGVISQGSLSTTTTVLAANIRASEVGMAVGYNVKCSIEEFVCSRLELFLEPYLKKLGIEFLKASRDSDDFNRYNLLNDEQSSKLIDEFTQEYKNLLDSTFEDLKVPDDGICFICNKAISKMVLIP